MDDLNVKGVYSLCLEIMILVSKSSYFKFTFENPFSSTI